jgi:hypothetical protein
MYIVTVLYEGTFYGWNEVLSKVHVALLSYENRILPKIEYFRTCTRTCIMYVYVYVYVYT